MIILGSGIDAININSSDLEKLNFSENEIKNIEIDLIDCGIYQPRKTHKISDETINELVASIREYGILQPIIVRFSSSKRYELIAGERRLKAAIKLGFKDVPAVLKKIDAQEAFAIALIENIQREQLSILEEAEALLKLKNDFLMTNESVALMIGKPRTTITNLIRLASNLTVFGKELLERGDVEYGHIRTVLVLEESIQNCVLNYVVERGLSVRQTEKFVKEKGYEKLLNPSLLDKNQPSIVVSGEFDSIIRSFSNIHGLKAKYRILADGKIRMSIDFDNADRVKKILL